MDPVGRALDAVSAEWGEKRDRLVAGNQRVLQRVKVTERVPGGGRAPRAFVAASGPDELLELARRAPFEATRPESYRGGDGAVPKSLSLQLSRVLDQWQADSASQAPISVDTRHEHWRVLEARVKRSRRRYFVDLDRAVVLIRIDPGMALGRAAARMTAVISGLSAPLWLWAAAGTTGAAVGGCIALVSVLGLVVGADAKSKSVIGSGPMR